MAEKVLTRAISLGDEVESECLRHAGKYRGRCRRRITIGTYLSARHREASSSFSGLLR
jgi:hypothetical protein